MAQSQRTILITGVSSGIGHALADLYLNRGDLVCGISRRTPADLCQREGFRFESLDLREFEGFGSVLDRLLDGLDRLDLVILNAGILGHFGDLCDTSIADLKNTLDINLWANKVLLDELLGAGLPVGQVVAISSGASVNGHRGWSGYSVSKAALNMLIKLYSAEQSDTHFTSLAPGVIDTEIQDELHDRPLDERYPSLEALRSKRGTPEMPTAEVAAPAIAACIDQLPELVSSGDYADIRQLPGHGQP